MLSALAIVARTLGRDLKDVPAHAGFIREQLKAVEPSMLKPPVGVGHWRNVLSLVNTAMRQAGADMSSVRYRAPVTREWQALLLKLDKHTRSGLSRLAQFCTAEGVPPEAVSDEVLTRFHAYLNQTLMTKSPREMHRMSCKLWNSAANVEGWPQATVKVPDYRNLYAVPWAQFPPSLKADLDRHLAHLGAKDILDYTGDFKPLKPISIKSRAHMLHAFASALVHRGKDSQTLTSLAALVEIEAFKDGLRFFLEQRTPGKRQRAHKMAVTLIPVAKYWVKVPPEHLKKLQEICRRLDTQPKGMTDKNRKMLAPFDDDDVVDAFLSVPALLMEEVERAEAEVARGKETPRRCRYSGRGLRTLRQRAQFVQTAVAFEILIMAPLRRANLGSIEIGVHLLPYRDGYRLQFEEREVKNEQRLAPPLPAESAKIVRTYIDRYRQHLVKRPSPFLFPGTEGSHKNFEALGRQIVKAAKAYGGITLTAHTFRHIAAKLHLRQYPGDYGTVKVFLGHKNIQTTIDAYCESEQPAAFERYDQHVLKLRRRRRDGESDSAKPKPKGR
jgi:integrase